AGAGRTRARRRGRPAASRSGSRSSGWQRSSVHPQVQDGARVRPSGPSTGAPGRGRPPETARAAARRGRASTRAARGTGRVGIGAVLSLRGRGRPPAHRRRRDRREAGASSGRGGAGPARGGRRRIYRTNVGTATVRVVPKGNTSRRRPVSHPFRKNIVSIVDYIIIIL